MRFKTQLPTVIVDVNDGPEKSIPLIIGALDAHDALQGRCNIHLVGDTHQITRIWREQWRNSPINLPQITEATKWIDSTTDNPLQSIRRNPEASIVVASKLLGLGKADALVGGGNTGALIAAGVLYVKRIKGKPSPALAGYLPTLGENKDKQVLILDCGATPEGKTPEEEAAILECNYHMAIAECSIIREIIKPRVYLLNNGTEPYKGRTSDQNAYQKLKGRSNFFGNIEARYILDGGADAVICNGFTGNVLVKSVEGTAAATANMFESLFKGDLFSKITQTLLKSKLEDLHNSLNYQIVSSGGLVLGLKRPVIKIHGNSSAIMTSNAIERAYDLQFNFPELVSHIEAHISHSE